MAMSDNGKIGRQAMKYTDAFYFYDFVPMWLRKLIVRHLMTNPRMQQQAFSDRQG